MSQSPVDLDAVESASRQLLEDRMASVRTLAQTRQDVHDQTNALRQAESVDKDAYDAALKAGWSAGELRKVGLGPLPKNTTGARTTTRGTTRRRTPTNGHTTDATNGTAGPAAATPERAASAAGSAGQDEATDT